MTTEPLKPCPFCGYAAIKERTVCDLAVLCTNPKCRASIIIDNQRRPSAISRWNRRTP